VRREARLEVDGVERRVQILSPSMYFSVETVRELDGTPVGDTGFGVNNVYLNGVRMAAVLPDGEAQYYLTDQVDSVKVVTNDAGMVVTSHEYLPFGEDWITEGDTKNAPKYNSQELDKESGYYFYNARHYDPEIARFVTPDTVIDGEYSTQGWNRFAYVHNNPIRYKDPTGHRVKVTITNEVVGTGSIRVYETPGDKTGIYVKVPLYKVLVTDDKTGKVNGQYAVTRDAWSKTKDGKIVESDFEPSGNDKQTKYRGVIEPNHDYGTTIKLRNWSESRSPRDDKLKTEIGDYRGKGYKDGIQIHLGSRKYDKGTYPVSSDGCMALYKMDKNGRYVAASESVSADFMKDIGRRRELNKDPKDYKKQMLEVIVQHRTDGQNVSDYRKNVTSQ